MMIYIIDVVSETNLMIDPLLLLGIIFVVVFACFFLFFYFTHKATRKTLKKEELTQDNEEVPYYRDIPFDNIEQAFYIATYYGMNANLSDFIGAVLLKWIKEKKIEILNQNGKMVIDMRAFFKKESEFESDLYIKLLVSANKDRMLAEEEFIAFFQNDDKRLFKMFETLSNEVEEKLFLEGLLIKDENDCGDKRITITEKLKEKALQLQGLKNFLIDFSRIGEREAISVELWEEYLMYAQLLGVADKVENQFDRIYPNYNLVVKTNIQKLAASEALKETGKFMARLLFDSSKHRRKISNLFE